MNGLAENVLKSTIEVQAGVCCYCLVTFIYNVHNVGAQRTQSELSITRGGKGKLQVGLIFAITPTECIYLLLTITAL